MRISLFLILFLSACNAGQGNQPDSAPENRPAIPLEPPPGTREESEAENFSRIVARAQALEVNQRRIEALSLYRKALATAPPNLPADERKALLKKTEQLSFLLGIPDAAVDDSRLSRASMSRPQSSSTQARAEALYTQAREAERQSDNSRALALYREALRSVRESENKELYWNAWQKVEDLSPEGEGPAALQEKRDLEEAQAAGQLGEEEGDDGSSVPTSRQDRVNAAAADKALGIARARYMKGLDYARAKDNTLARRAFQDVIELIRESQDPELYRAARQNLVDLDREKSIDSSDR